MHMWCTYENPAKTSGLNKESGAAFSILGLWFLLSFTCIAFGQMSDTEDSYEQARQRMVDNQIAYPFDSRPAVGSNTVIQAMRVVPRHKFVGKRYIDMAYTDRPLPIGHGQTISQPYIVAYMTELLGVKENDVVLEVGTGSGYQAAILAQLAKHVYSIEIVEPLAQQSMRTLSELGYKNVTVKAGDGYLGWPEHAPFDSIIVTAAPDHVPQPLIDQLKPGGRLVLPVGPTWSTQKLTLLIKRQDGGVDKEIVMAVGFVPLVREQDQ